VSHSRLILVIEDNPADIRLIKEAIRDCGLDVVLETAQDGEQALKFLKRENEYENAQRPSLIFLDLNLPRGTSKDILRFLKTNPNLRMIPVAVLTSSDAERDIREAYELYANCYLRKPVELDAFLSVIRETVNYWTTVARIPSE
jgi:CheY-like chemotaxis protein